MNLTSSPSKYLQKSRSELNQLVRGVPIQCIVRQKANNGFQREDIQVQGSRVGILDANNRVRDEYETSEVFNEEASNSAIFNRCFPPYLRALVEGVNVSVFMYGATGTGKSHTAEGQGADTGFVTLIADNLFNVLEEKRYQVPSFQFGVKIRHMQILDEEVTDLLQPGGSPTFIKEHIRVDEWEGPYMQGVQWIPVPSASQLNDFFRGGLRNKTQRSNEFGRMRDKAAVLFQIEVTQNMLHGSSGEGQVIVSRVNVL